MKVVSDHGSDVFRTSYSRSKLTICDRKTGVDNGDFTPRCEISLCEGCFAVRRVLPTYCIPASDSISSSLSAASFNHLQNSIVIIHNAVQVCPFQRAEGHSAGRPYVCRCSQSSERHRRWRQRCVCFALQFLRRLVLTCPLFSRQA
jgi:hypothetical protein